MEIIANSIPGGVIKLRMNDKKIIYSNDGFYLLSGYSRSEFHMNFGDYFDQILYPADMEFVQGQLDTAIENFGLLGFECRILSKNNEVKWLYINGRRIDDDCLCSGSKEGGQCGVVVVSKSIGGDKGVAYSHLVERSHYSVVLVV